MEVFSSECPKVSSCEAEADDVFKVVEAIKNEVMHFCGQVENGDRMACLAAFGSCELAVSWGAGEHFAVGFAFRTAFRSDLLQRVVNGYLGDAMVVLGLCWYR